MCFLFLILGSWDTYFPLRNFTETTQHQQLSKQKIVSSGCAFVESCFFEDTNGTAKGGAIYCTGAEILMVESSTIIRCRAHDSGGGIYFSNTINGQFVALKVCISECSSGKSERFIYAEVTQSLEKKNFFNDCCVLNAASEIGSISRFRCGNTAFMRTNISNNKGSKETSFQFLDHNKFLFAYTSFTDLEIREADCMYHVCRSNINPEIKSCNFIGNSCGNYIFTAIGSIKFTKTCFLFNKPGIRVLNSDGSGKITLDGCTIEDKLVANIIATNPPATSFINDLYFDSCNTDPEAIRTPNKFLVTCKANDNNIAANGFYHYRHVINFLI